MTIATEARRRPEFGFTHRLVLAREVAGIDQQAVADALEVSRGTISNYERGVTQPSRLQVREWAMLCGVDLEWLTTGETRFSGPNKLRIGYSPREVIHLHAAA